MSLVTPEAYVDQCSTTVAVGGYTSGSGVLNVASTGAPFPQTQQFHFYIADQNTKAVKAIGKATALNSSTQWAVSMSLDANASAGDLVVLSLCSGAMDQIRADCNQIGARASLPGTTGQKAGNRYKCNDSPYEYIFDGSVWQPFVDGWNVSEPVSGSPSFSWGNQGGASVSNAYGGEYLTCPQDNSGNVRLRYIAQPARPYTITVAMRFSFIQDNYFIGGMGFYDSGSGKLYACAVNNNTNGGSSFNVGQWNSLSSFNTYTQQHQIWGFTGMWWARVTDDGTNFYFYASSDGIHWIQLDTGNRTGYLTPGYVGYFGDCLNGNYDMGVHLLHWKQS